MKSSKIIFTADIHAGVPNKLHHTKWAMDVMREYAHRNGIGSIIVLGDLTHDRVSIGIDVLSMLQNQFDESKKQGISWIAFPGNHDQFLRFSWASTSLDCFRNTIDVIDRVAIVKIGNRRYWVLPFIHMERSFGRVLHEIELQYQDGDVLLTHVGTTGAIKNACFLLKDWTVINFDNSPFERVYTGHFHVHQKVGRNTIYPGSPIPYKADEGDCDHGFIVHDPETLEDEFIDIWKVGAEYFPDVQPPPNYLTIPIEMAASADQSIFRNNIIRLYSESQVTLNEKSSLVDHLTKLGAVTTTILTAPQKDDQIVKVVKNSGEELLDVLLRTDKAASSLNHKLLKAINQTIKSKGDSMYAATN